MTSISNMKIGKKITLVLGAIVLLLAGLSGLSLWGIRTNEKLAVTLVQRLTKARLAEQVSGLILRRSPCTWQRWCWAGKRSERDRRPHYGVAGTRAAALEQFRAMVDTPTSIKHGRGNGGTGPNHRLAANDGVMAALGAGQIGGRRQRTFEPHSR